MEDGYGYMLYILGVNFSPLTSQALSNMPNVSTQGFFFVL